MKHEDYIAQSILRESFLESFGIKRENYLPKPLPSPDILRKTERNPLFNTYRLNRKIMGALRYGLFNDPKKAVWARITAIEEKISLYKSDGNDEHLLDIANYAELEFTEGQHPKKHFKAIDNTDNHCTL